MKRIIAVLLVLLMTAACQPTPEREYVINKSDDVLDQKLHAAPLPIPEDTVYAEANNPGSKPTNADSIDETASGNPSDETADPAQAAGRTFPAHWNDTIEMSDAFTITIDAPVVTRADGVYPVWRTKDGRFEPAEILSILNTLLAKPVKQMSGSITKEMVAGQIEAFNEQASRWQQWRAKGSPENERPDGEELSDEEIAIILDEFKEQLRLAPERDEEKPVSAFDPGLIRAVYALENGKTATVVLQEQTLHFSLGSGNFVSQSRHELDLRYPAEAEYDVNCWKPATLTLDKATEMLWEALEKIGYDGFAIASVQEGNLIRIDGRASEASGWMFTLARDYGGYPLELDAQADERIRYVEGDDFEANAPVTHEELQIMVAEDGIVSFTHGGRKKIVGVVNENVELLPFPEIRERAVDGIRYGFTGYGRTDHYQGRFTVFKAVLTTYTLRIRNEEGYYEMPCWVLLFDHTIASGAYEHDEDGRYRALVINAVDGSIVNPKLGY